MPSSKFAVAQADQGLLDEAVRRAIAAKTSGTVAPAMLRRTLAKEINQGTRSIFGLMKAINRA